MLVVKSASAVDALEDDADGYNGERGERHCADGIDELVIRA